MKLFQMNRDALLGPLQAVSGIVEKRHTLPILSNVLIRRQQRTLSMIATDLEIQVSTVCEEVENDGEDIAFTVSARKLQEILRALPEGSEATLDLQNGRLDQAYKNLQSATLFEPANAELKRVLQEVDKKRKGG